MGRLTCLGRRLRPSMESVLTTRQACHRKEFGVLVDAASYSRSPLVDGLIELWPGTTASSRVSD
jgi:hypothetical protein